MPLGSGESHSPVDIHVTLCEVISSRLRVPCVTELIVELLLEVNDSDITALLEEKHEEI